MFKLAFEAKNEKKKVLVLTTTKIYLPDKSYYDYIDLSGNIFANKKIQNSGIYLNAPFDRDLGKVISTNIDLLKDKINLFDLILIESDGAKEKSLKGWNEFEPVVPNFVTKTIGVFDIKSIGKEINQINVHRVEIFRKLIDANIGDIFTVEYALKIIKNKNGLFKNSKGNKLLFINKVETETDRFYADKIINYSDMKCIAGSLKYGEIYAYS
jgi:probable selenium-dependent hydroxylase accessory protein YqeC